MSEPVAYTESVECENDDKEVDEVTNEHECVQIMADSEGRVEKPVVKFLDWSRCVINSNHKLS